ncbi:MAG TPA: trypsin-like peptidase domain-containing protein [Kofleriaceae bacterium]|jgi:S1-C subfamily serine protease
MAQPALDVFRALDQALAAAVSAAAASTVHIARGRDGGSGIVWAEDVVITSSFHCPDTTKVGIATDDGKLDSYDAEVIGRDPSTDIAVLRVSGAKLTPAKFRPIGDLAVGNLALAVGRPGRTARASLRAIGVLGPEIETPRGGRLDRYIESDRLIPRGFAGGPLIDADGHVIGMNTRTLLRGADLAIPTATIERVVTEILAHGGVRRGYAGVGAYPAQGGALVANLDDDGPAKTAGVLVGDLIVELDGEAISGPDSLRSALAPRSAKVVKLVVVRGGVRTELDLTIGTK